MARTTGPDQVPPWYVQAPAPTLMTVTITGPWESRPWAWYAQALAGGRQTPANTGSANYRCARLAAALQGQVYKPEILDSEACGVRRGAA
jgi:hypothetical protein